MTELKARLQLKPHSLTQFITCAITSDLQPEESVSPWFGFIHRSLRSDHINSASSAWPQLSSGAGVRPDLQPVITSFLHASPNLSSPLPVPHQISVEQICNCALQGRTTASCSLIPAKPSLAAAHRRLQTPRHAASRGTAVITFISSWSKCVVSLSHADLISVVYEKEGGWTAAVNGM